MVDSILTSLDLLDITSVTVPGSLFFYVVNDGNPRKVSAQDMSASVLGGIKQYATKTKDNADWAKDVIHPQAMSVTVNDTYGLVDVNSATLFRIPDDSIQYAQLIGQGDWESYIGQNGVADILIDGGGLPDDKLRYRGSWNWTNNNISRFQCVTPRIRVQSGSYFWMEARHSHSIDRMFPEFNRAFCFFSIWCW